MTEWEEILKQLTETGMAQGEMGAFKLTVPSDDRTGSWGLTVSYKGGGAVFFSLRARNKQEALLEVSNHCIPHLQSGSSTCRR